jgi:hypothetical protein
MPPLLDSILGKFPPLGVSSVSHDHLRAFIHLVGVSPAVFRIPTTTPMTRFQFNPSEQTAIQSHLWSGLKCGYELCVPVCVAIMPIGLIVYHNYTILSTAHCQSVSYPCERVSLMRARPPVPFLNLLPNTGSLDICTMSQTRIGTARETKDRREHEADKSSEWRGRFSEHHQAD